MLKITWPWSSRTSKKEKVVPVNCAPSAKAGRLVNAPCRSVAEMLACYGSVIELLASLEEAQYQGREVRQELLCLAPEEFSAAIVSEKLSHCLTALESCYKHATALQNSMLQNMGLGGQKTQKMELG